MNSHTKQANKIVRPIHFLALAVPETTPVPSKEPGWLTNLAGLTTKETVLDLDPRKVTREILERGLAKAESGFARRNLKLVAFVAWMERTSPMDPLNPTGKKWFGGGAGSGGSPLVGKWDLWKGWNPLRFDPDAIFFD